MSSWDYIMKFVIAGEASVGKTSILFRLTDERFLATPDPTIGVEFGSKLLRVAPPSAPSTTNPSAQSSSNDPQPPHSPSTKTASHPSTGASSSSKIPPTGPSPAPVAAADDDDAAQAKWIKIQCWDVAGSPSFRAVTRSYYRGASASLLVYDVTRPETFDQIPSWLADIRAHADPDVVIILIGNKADLIPAPAVAPPPPSPANDDADDAEAPSSTSDAASPPAPAAAALPAPTRPRVPTAQARAYAERESLLFLETSAKTGSNVAEAFDAAARAILGKVLEGQLDAKGRRKGEPKRGIQLGEGGAGKGKAGGCC